MQEKKSSSTKINFRGESFRKYFKNTSWLFAEKIIRLGITLLVNIYLLRYLGPHDSGVLNYALSFVALFSYLATLGLDKLTIRELVKSPTDRDRIVGTTFFLRIVGSVLTILLVLAAIGISGDSGVVVWMIIIIGIGSLFQSFQVIDYYFQSKVEARYSVYALSSAVMIASAAKVISIFLEAPLITFAIIQAGEYFLWAIGYTVVYKMRGLSILKWKFEQSLVKKFLTDSWPLILSGIAINIYLRVDQVMLKQMLNEEAVGYYAAAVRLCEAWYFLPIAIVSSLFPAIVNARENVVLYKNRLQKLYDLMILLSVGIAIPVTYIAPFIIELLYGAEFLPGAPVLAIYIWAGVPIFMGVASGHYLLSENFTKVAFMRSMIGLLLNVGINFYLIPKYGIVGASWATIISYSISTFSLGLLKKTRGQFYMMLRSLFMISFVSYILSYLKKK